MEQASALVASVEVVTRRQASTLPVALERTIPMAATAQLAATTLAVTRTMAWAVDVLPGRTKGKLSSSQIFLEGCFAHTPSSGAFSSGSGGNYADDNYSYGSSKKSDSTMGRMMEKAGDMFGSDTLQAKGQQKRSQAGGYDDSGSGNY